MLIPLLQTVPAAEKLSADTLVTKGAQLVADYKKVSYWLNESICKELPKHGIFFPFPQLDIHMK